MNASDKAGRHPIHWASIGGHENMLKFVLEECASKGILKDEINCQTKGGMSSLHAVAEAGHIGCLKLLLMAEADKTLKDKDGKTPLDLATHAKKIASVKILTKGVDADLTKSEGCVIC